MDIRSYFGSKSQVSSDAKADSDSEDHGSDSSDPESSPSPPPSKKVCKSSKKIPPFCIHEEKILEELGEGFQLAVL